MAEALLTGPPTACLCPTGELSKRSIKGETIKLADRSGADSSVYKRKGAAIALVASGWLGNISCVIAAS